MKKIAALVSALLLVCGISGCSKEDVPAALPETEHDAAESTPESPVELDLFAMADVALDSDGTKSVEDYYPYPTSFHLYVTSTDDSLPDKAIKIRLLSAGLETITYELVADEDRLRDYLEENNFFLKEVSKEYSMNVSEFPSLLISTDLLTEENMQIILSSMEDSVNSYIEWSNGIAEEAIAWGVTGADGLHSTNFAPAACYAALPDADMDYTFLIEEKETLDTRDGFNCYDHDYALCVIFEGEDGRCYICKADTEFDSNHKLSDKTRYHKVETKDSFDEAVAYVSGLYANMQQLDVLPESIKAAPKEEIPETNTTTEP